jgi:hypothetical protein
MNLQKNWKLYVGGAGLLAIAATIIYRRIEHKVVVNELNKKLLGTASNANPTYGDFRDMLNENYWSTSYYKGKPTSIYAATGGFGMIKKIYDAKGKVWDTETDVLDVFKELKYKSDVSKLADIFNAQYKTSLLEYLKSFMDDKYMVELNEILKNLK